MKALIDRHDVIVCTGSGGVGKTTTSAALATLAAGMGRRVLVLTIDPARRLATTLGIDAVKGEVRVPGQQFAGEFHAAMIDQKEIFESFIERAAPDAETLARLRGNTLYQQLSTTLSGAQEFTSCVKLHDAASCGKYDLVILDTPPAAHAVNFLLAPQRLNALFDNAVMSLFMERTTGLRLAAAAWKQGVKIVLESLRLMTGSEFVGTLRDFFVCIDAMAPRIREKNQAAHALLLSPRTAFVLITSFDQAKIQEGVDFHRELEAGGYHLRQVIVNRAWPAWVQADPVGAAARLEQLNLGDSARLCRELGNYYRQRGGAHERFPNVILVPEMERAVVGLRALTELGETLSGAERARVQVRGMA